MNSYKIVNGVVYFHIHKRNRILTAKIDECDLPLFLAHNWTSHADHGTHYVSHHGPRPSQTKVYLHRAIMGFPEGLDVDHINGDGLDNRRFNLRAVTRSENIQNMRRLRRDNTSGVRGVTFSKTGGKWWATVSLRGEVVYKEWFMDKSNAALVVALARAVYLPYSPEAAAA